MTADFRIGTAGWSIPRASAARFDVAGTHLQRYSLRLRCAEINSSFYRTHTRTTYAKWRNSTPADFRFSIKMPRTITHELKLRDARDLLTAFLSQTEGLGDKRGPILVQLPPSYPFDETVVSSFLASLREMYDGAVVCEPRHSTWFAAGVDSVLDHYRVSRVAADPPPVPEAMVPAGWARLAYFRLHGTPRKYWSRYSDSDITALAAAARRLPDAAEVWVIFDNTASGAAMENACEMSEQLRIAAA